MIQIVQGVIGGVLSGGVAALLGFVKTNAGTEFDAKNFFQTLVVGGVVGGVAGYNGITYAEALDYLVTTGGLTLLEYVKKALYRRVVKPYVLPKLKKFWNEKIVPFLT